MSTYKNFTNKVELDSWSNFAQEQQIYEQRDNKKKELILFSKKLYKQSAYQQIKGSCSK